MVHSQCFLFVIQIDEKGQVVEYVDNNVETEYFGSLCTGNKVSRKNIVENHNQLRHSSEQYPI